MRFADARVRRYAELLASEGHTVDVLCLGEGDAPKAESHLGVGIHRIRQARLRGGRLSYAYEYFSAFVRELLSIRFSSAVITANHIFADLLLSRGVAAPR